MVTLLVIAVPGSVDLRWLHEFVEAQLRSSDRVAAGQDADVAALPHTSTDSETPKLLTVDNLQMDLEQMRVHLAGRPIEFTHQEFLLLKTFMQNPRQVFTRQQLLGQAWEYGDWGVGRTVDVHVRRVRVKLGTDAPQIVTVRGFGYRFDPGEG